jgi:hypothetical protein
MRANRQASRFCTVGMEDPVPILSQACAEELMLVGLVPDDQNSAHKVFIHLQLYGNAPHDAATIPHHSGVFKVSRTSSLCRANFVCNRQSESSDERLVDRTARFGFNP